jgi:alpha-L-rhamnosidase
VRPDAGGGLADSGQVGAGGCGPSPVADTLAATSSGDNGVHACTSHDVGLRRHRLSSEENRMPVPEDERGMVTRRNFGLGGMGVALGLALPVGAGTATASGAERQKRPNVAVRDLRVNGRYDHPLGIDDTDPLLGWRMEATSQRGGRNGPNATRPADEQTAYQIQAAASRPDLDAGKLTWDTGKVESSDQCGIRYGGKSLGSRERVVWRLRVWDAEGNPSEWSEPAVWDMGLLEQDDWGRARWIEYPGRTEDQPMPIFARRFHVDPAKKVSRARLYLSGIGLHLPTLNGATLTNEVLAPGNSNYQLSVEYRTYDVTDLLVQGANTIGVRLGNGTAYVRRSVTNPAVGRTAPYSWWESQLKGSGALAREAVAGDTTVRLSSVADYHVGGTINIDTGDGGDHLESRTITAIGTAGADGTGITFTPALAASHAAGALVTGSGNNIAATDPSAGAAVTPRLIARLEIDYADQSEDVIVSDRSWRCALGPLVTDAWYSGADYDARREQPGWDEPDSDLSSAAKRRDGSEVGWISAGIAPVPNLATKLVGRNAEPVEVVEELSPISMTNPKPGTFVFDFGQNFAGWPELNFEVAVPSGTVVRMSPAESLAADGTVDQASLMGGGASRGTNLFNTYTAAGTAAPESWRPDFNYFGMQFLQVSGLPDDYRPTKALVKGYRLHATTPQAGELTTSNARVNRLHRMAQYSIASNMMSVFTDCPGREKLSYPADYTMPMGAIHRNFELAAYMKTTMRHLVEGQSIADTSMKGNVALKTPVYDWGYTDNFGDEINWGNAIILVPSLLHELYGDTATMAEHYDDMVLFADYIQREKVGSGPDLHIVDAALSDWIAAEQTSGRITGTWGYYTMTTKLAAMAELTGHTDDAAEYRALAHNIKNAFNAHFYNRKLHRYTAEGNAGTTGATQAAQALALDAGLVPPNERAAVLDSLVELVYAFHPNGSGPHFSGGTIGMAPTVRALMNGDRDDVLWDLLQRNDEPSYGFFLESTVANPNGMTTLGEQWDRGNSKNHMILAQIEEWFHSGLAGIRAAEGSLAYRELVIQPKVVGDIDHVRGSYRTPQGVVRSEWNSNRGRFELKVEIPANTSAEVRVPFTSRRSLHASARARFVRTEGRYAVYAVGSGAHTFASVGSRRG